MKTASGKAGAVHAWDAAFAKAADPSGRAIAGVHEQAVTSG
jgi:asparagine synthase (glutamine-hydrolysing)